MNGSTEENTSIEEHSLEEQPYCPTQAELYDDLRAIGEKEDEKKAIQYEIDTRTDKLRSALPHLDKDTLLHKMIAAALGTKGSSAGDSAVQKRTAKKKTAKKK